MKMSEETEKRLNNIMQYGNYILYMQYYCDNIGINCIYCYNSKYTIE